MKKYFLKRNLISDYTKEVLKKRIQQSELFLLLLTDNVIVNGEITSEWINMEIEHAKSVGKKICCLNFTNLPEIYSSMDWITSAVLSRFTFTMFLHGEGFEGKEKYFVT